jgi:hypothetical protein
MLADHAADGFVRGLAGDAGTGEHAFDWLAQVLQRGIGAAGRLAFARQQVDQGIGDRERGIPVGAVGAFAQRDHRQVVRPAARQEVGDRQRQVLALDAVAQLRRGKRARLLEAFLAALRLGRAAFGQLDAAVVLFEEGAQLLLEGLEDGDVLVELRRPAGPRSPRPCAAARAPAGPSPLLPSTASDSELSRPPRRDGSCTGTCAGP